MKTIKAAIITILIMATFAAYLLSYASPAGPAVGLGSIVLVIFVIIFVNVYHGMKQ